jgi:hypothetical protein
MASRSDDTTKKPVEMEDLPPKAPDELVDHVKGGAAVDPCFRAPRRNLTDREVEPCWRPGTSSAL